MLKKQILRWAESHLTFKQLEISNSKTDTALSSLSLSKKSSILTLHQTFSQTEHSLTILNSTHPTKNLPDWKWHQSLSLFIIHRPNRIMISSFLLISGEWRLYEITLFPLVSAWTQTVKRHQAVPIKITNRSHAILQGFSGNRWKCKFLTKIRALVT